MEISGILKEKYPTQTVSDKFKKREFVLELQEEINGNTYTNYAKMQLVQAKCDLLDKANIGDTLTVHFNIKGNKWEKDGKVNYMTNLDTWKIEVTSQGQPQYTNNFYNTQPDQVDDLPF